MPRWLPVIALLIALCAAPAARADVRQARAWAADREGRVSFCVRVPGQPPRGLHRTAAYPSASIVKAMLLVAALRRARGRPLPVSERSRITPMIRRSDNLAGYQVYAVVGPRGLRRVARAAGMLRFEVGERLYQSRIDASDQARLFLALDEVVPRRHRRYARWLLGHVVREQRWGIPQASARRGWRTYFKGGWQSTMVGQVALLERRRRRVAVAVLTQGSPSQAYGERTIQGIARRILG
jgi:Beta-lactamase enzyme family